MVEKMTEEKIEQFLNIRRGLKPIINPDSCALIIIDMQDYQVRKHSPVVKIFETFAPGMLDYFINRVDAVVTPNIARLLNLFQEHHLPVFFTKFASNRKDCGDYPYHIRAFNKLANQTIGEYVFPSVQSPTADLIPELAPQENDVILIKTTSGTFSSTDLDHQLKNLSVESVIVTGVVTHMCVENTCRIASDLGYNVFLVDDACAGWSEDLHESAIRAMELLFVHVSQTDEVIKKLRRMLHKK